MHRRELLRSPLLRQLRRGRSHRLTMCGSSCGDFAYSRWAEVEVADAAAHTVPLEVD